MTSAYDEAPLNRLERVDSTDIENWISQEFPFVGTAIDWSQVPGVRRRWFARSEVELEALVPEFLDALPKCSDIAHVGDNLSPCSTRVPIERLGEFLPALLEIPEHHYFVPDDRSWIAVVRFEGEVDLVMFETRAT